MIPYLADIAHNVSYIGESISVIIFTLMGAYMLYKAWKNEGILERLSDINYKQLSAAAFFTSLDALFAGMGFGLLQARFYIVALSILIVTAFFLTSLDNRLFSFLPVVIATDVFFTVHFITE